MVTFQNCNFLNTLLIQIIPKSKHSLETLNIYHLRLVINAIKDTSVPERNSFALTFFATSVKEQNRHDSNIQENTRPLRNTKLCKEILNSSGRR